MNSKKEIILHFPTKKNNMEEINYLEFKDEIIIKSLLEETSVSAEKFNDEWQQEYFLIYNSYRMEESFYTVNES